MFYYTVNRHFEVRYPKDKNYAINVHEYFTSSDGGGGAEAPCIAPSVMLEAEKFNDFKKWLSQQESKGYHPKVFLSEVGGLVDKDANCKADIDMFISAMEGIPYKENTKAGFIGWTAWAGGAAWGDEYVANLSPTKTGRERELMTTFSQHLTPPSLTAK